MTTITRAVKKRLQENLENLTALEAGRLFAIYAMEADKKGKSVDDYGPVKELDEALRASLAKSRGKPEERETVNRYNGYVLLRALWEILNGSPTAGLLIAFAFDSFKVMTAILLLLHEDATSETIRTIRDAYGSRPSPVSPEDYDLLIEWAKTEELYSINDATNFIFDNFDDQTHEERNTAVEVIRGEMQSRLESGEITFSNLVREMANSSDNEDPIFVAIYDDLVDRLDAGELVGGEGVTIDGATLLIEEGTIPAWVALRATWRRFVEQAGLRVAVGYDVEEWAPALVDSIGTRNGDIIDDKELRRLATNFYKDCRRRPWGKGLIAKPNVDDLVRLLTQSSTPFLQIKPFDFGRVAWAAFQKSETNSNGEPYESEPVVTFGSLAKLPEDVRKGEAFLFNIAMTREDFYPVESFAGQRQDMKRAFAMMNRIANNTRQPFSYDRIEEGLYSMSEVMGIKFMTPLENQVENFRRVADQVAGLKAALKIIGDRYFGGLPVLVRDFADQLKQAEDNLATTKEILSQWTDDLKRWPWNVDTSALEVGEPEVDQEFADGLIADFLKDARAITRIREDEATLFGGGNL